MVRPQSSEVHFGGPDMAPGTLRNLLAERVAAVPSGGAIDWVAYYFRDRRLAQELLKAKERGVRVRVTIDAGPRTPHANQAVADMLAGPGGLGDDFRSLDLPAVPALFGKRIKLRLHQKLYCFSHPRPVALIGSFNPSGDVPEEHPEIIDEIGDQDRGHNVLVGLHDPLLVKHLSDYAGWLNRAQPGLFRRFSAAANQTIKGEDVRIYFWPRSFRHPVLAFLNRMAPGARIRIVASHLKGDAVVKKLISVARKGASMEFLAEPTLRRVPMKTEALIRDAGIPFHRVGHVQGLPMHNKFVLAEKNGRRYVIFGSFNWNSQSYWLNGEIGAISADPGLFDAFAERWEVLKAQAGAS